MKALLFALVPTLALATLSPFESSVEGISIANTHEVSEGVLRGSEPKKLVSELADYGIDEVIIFKTQTKTEVDDELAALALAGIKSHHIPFKWKELTSYQEACEQVVAALTHIRRAQKAGKKLFFHCTVGEDRTGLLAGLVRMENEGLTASEAWNQEMCPRGYAEGNAQKPRQVVAAIHQGLTPLYFALAAKIEAGETLTKRSCASLEVAEVKRSCRR